MPVQILNKSIRDDIYRRTLAAVGNPVQPGQCLEFAWHGYRLLKSWPGAPRTIIQAGSAQWPRVPKELDDGVSPTHFAYEWDPNADVTRLVRNGIIPVMNLEGGPVASLPELHVWLACPDTGEIIDFTTGFWPEACRAVLGLDWLAARPPDYFWNFGSRLPDGVRYIAYKDAIETVIEILRLQDRQYP